MTEMELIDRLNPRRELPQVICDAISKTWEVMNKENEQLVKYCKELEAGFLNYKKNYKTKRQQVYEMEIKIENLEKENTELCERLEAVAKESGKALTRQIIAESMVVDLQKEKVVWHDLKTNPDDLPKRNDRDISDYVITDRGFGYYNWRIKSWWTKNDCALTDDVIAWCEIPKFEVVRCDLH